MNKWKSLRVEVVSGDETISLSTVPFDRNALWNEKIQINHIGNKPIVIRLFAVMSTGSEMLIAKIPFDASAFANIPEGSIWIPIDESQSSDIHIGWEFLNKKRTTQSREVTVFIPTIENERRILIPYRASLSCAGTLTFENFPPLTFETNDFPLSTFPLEKEVD